MPFRPDPQEGFEAIEFQWTEEFMAKPVPERVAILQGAREAVEEKLQGGDLLAAISIGIQKLRPWLKLVGLPIP